MSLLATLVLVLLPDHAAAAPDPGGSESAPFNGATKDRYFGFSGIRQFGEPDPGTAAAYIDQAGGNMSRTAMHWQALEPRRDSYSEPSFRPYEQLYSALRARGIKPILMVQFAPFWARDPGTPQECGAADACHYPPARSMLGEWQEFVRELARRFPAAAIEVWNEPNYASQWQPAPEPERYAELLAAAREAARSVNPGAMVLAGGLAMHPRQRWVGPGEFLRRAYAATPSLKGNTDALNFHVFPAHDLGANSTFAEAFEIVRRERAAAGDGGTPLLITELGVSTSGNGGVNEDEQAQRVIRALKRIFSMEDTLGALVYTLADRNELPTVDPERGYGTTRAKPGLLGLGSNVEPKLAYCTLRRAVAAILLDMNCPPETEIVAGPPLIAPGNQVEFRFRSPDVTALAFECSFDGAPFRACRPPVRYGNLAPGPHGFAVRARDLLGRIDPFPARYPFAVDRNDRRLAVQVDPRRTRVRSKKRRPARLRVSVSNPGAPLHTRGVEVCGKTKAKFLRLKKRCVRLPDIAPGATGAANFKAVPRKRGKGRKVDVRFTARAERTLPGKAKARVKIR